MGLVGRNGAGKTTIIRMVTAQTVPTEGEVSLFGASGERELSKMRARTGAMVETPSFYPYLTARQNLEYYRIQRGIPGKNCVDEALELVNLTDTGKKKFKTFSLGMKQRLGLALALMNQPEFLLLDEPINGLDPQGIAEVRETILRLNKERNMTILISSHILEELSKIATDYGIIHQGTLLQEITDEELRERCSERLEITLSSPELAIPVLDRLGIRRYQVMDKEHIYVFERLDESARLNMEFAKAGIPVKGLAVTNEELETYFLNLTGGNAHA